MSSIIKVNTVQDTDGNNIINENANTITIGASGDTISIPAGATLANNGTATGFASITWQSSVKTANFIPTTLVSLHEPLTLHSKIFHRQELMTNESKCSKDQTSRSL